MRGISTGRDFGMAFCAHFGLPATQVDSNIQMIADADSFFAATISICLSPDDLAGIAAHMGGKLPAGFAKTEAVDGAALDVCFDTWMRLRTEVAHAAYQSRMGVLSACDAVEAQERTVGKLKQVSLAMQGIR